MNWNTHLPLDGKHAFLGASKYHWINYDDEKLYESFDRFHAAKKGSELHEWAATTIKLKIRQAEVIKTLNMYINDAIGFDMQTEQILFYSIHCFGTCDAISFKKNKLRIHDLKTGITPASNKQLEIYAALFCLEYGYKPRDIDIELRLYQNNDVQYSIPRPEEIDRIMDKIVDFDLKLEKINAGG